MVLTIVTSVPYTNHYDFMGASDVFDDLGGVDIGMLRHFYLEN